MALGRPGFAPGEGGELNVRTLPGFSGVLRLLPAGRQSPIIMRIRSQLACTGPQLRIAKAAL